MGWQGTAMSILRAKGEEQSQRFWKLVEEKAVEMLEIKKRNFCLRGERQQGRLRERGEETELGYIYQGDNHNNMLEVWQGCS